MTLQLHQFSPVLLLVGSGHFPLITGHPGKVLSCLSMQNQYIEQVTHFANMFYFTKEFTSKILIINMSLFW